MKKVRRVPGIRDSVLALAVMALSLSAFAPARAWAADERIDRVLAVVNGTVITESDVRAALDFGLARVPSAGADPIRTTLNLLIRRELIVREVARSTPAELAPGRIDAALGAIRARFASRAEYEARLEQTAMTETRLHDMVETDLLVQDYLTQRFGAVAEPGDAEIAGYYDAHRGEFTSGGRQLTLDEAKAAIRERLIGERRRQLVEDWVARLRRRAEVTDVYFAAPAR